MPNKITIALALIVTTLFFLGSSQSTLAGVCQGGAWPDCSRYGSATCNTDFDYYAGYSVTHKRVGQGADDPGTPHWPAWSVDGGQNDLIWHTNGSCSTNWFWYPGVNDNMFCDIDLSQHPISNADSTIAVHTYINNRATNCSGINFYWCRGAVNISSGAVTVGMWARHSSLIVNGGSITVNGGMLYVGCTATGD